MKSFMTQSVYIYIYIYIMDLVKNNCFSKSSFIYKKIDNEFIPINSIFAIILNHLWPFIRQLVDFFQVKSADFKHKKFSMNVFNCYS